ncbi:hypothetical protein M422DRAFT_192871 [Sphaerobolus stellatus SS14]|uniref:Unplaced genomic scaffold SPHSTscaffold_318, whole genome shotgun sequence n=1 Tax=Sphaerobolus stellatus (strain SS14) TaxID=990650 RepID=A0A0C9TA45_SPHS4|nr:hypothetical protein M422DRAFT_192871 [Sphaerobolus stellatus SS14]
MPAADATSQCPALSGPEDYQQWKLRIKSILNWEKVGDTLLGRPVTIPPMLLGSTMNGHLEIQDAKAHSIITQYISDQLLLHLASETTMKGLFDHTVKIFEKTNVGITTFYKFILMMSLQWDGKSPVVQHISAISATNA